MSFSKPTPVDLPHALEHSRYRTKKNTVNLLQLSTIGLSSLHRSINTSNLSLFRNSSGRNDLHITGNDGFLDLRWLHSSSSAELLIARRFQCKRLLATGTFAQIFTAYDLYTQRDVALKIMKRGCELLAQREKVFLDCLSVTNGNGDHYFVRCLGLTTFASHECLALQLYVGTLMDYVRDATSILVHDYQSQKSAPNTPLGISSQSTILQPRAIRSSVIPSSYVNKNLVSSPQQSGNKPTRTFSSDDLNKFRKIALQLVSALCILQQKDIIHGDLKPENCFLEYQVNNSSSTSSSQSDSYTSSIPRVSSSPNIHSIRTQPIPHQSSRHKALSSLPSDFNVKLGDFGNSLHVSETNYYLEEFEIQSLPYRAPEVLLGIPFTSAIDVWSLGIILIELITGQTFFTCTTREEAVAQIKQKISDIPRSRFSTGKYSSCLSSSNHTLKSEILFAYDHGKIRANQFRNIKRLLVNSTQLQFPASIISEMADFLTSLTIVDPILRSTPLQALQHPFLVSSCTFPISLLRSRQSENSEQVGQSIKKKRKYGVHSSNGGVHFSSLET